MYDALSPRKYKDKNGQEKTTFTKIGVAFANKDGDGFSLNLNAYPLPDEKGEVRIVCKTPKPKDVNHSTKSSSEFDDTIPF